MVILRLTKMQVKELKKDITKEKDNLFPDFVKVCEQLPHNMPHYRSIKKTIAKYNFLCGQTYAYTKILEIMNLKV